MSDLKHLSLEQLKEAKEVSQEQIEHNEELISKLEASGSSQKEIDRLKSQIYGQTTRLEWIERYTYQKTPQKLTHEQIEERLGHKVVVPILTSSPNP